MSAVAELLAALVDRPIGTDPGLSFEFYSDLRRSGPSVCFFREPANGHVQVAAVWHDSRRERWGWSLGPDSEYAEEQDSETTAGAALDAVLESIVATGGGRCMSRPASHVTHGKNGVPELPAVTDEDERIERLRRDLIAIVRGGAR